SRRCRDCRRIIYDQLLHKKCLGKRGTVQSALRYLCRPDAVDGGRYPILVQLCHDYHFDADNDVYRYVHIRKDRRQGSACVEIKIVSAPCRFEASLTARGLLYFPGNIYFFKAFMASAIFWASGSFPPASFL